MQVLSQKFKQEQVKVSALTYEYRPNTNFAFISSPIDLTDDDAYDATDSVPAKRQRRSVRKGVKGKFIKYTSCESLWMGDTLKDFTSLIEGNETAHEASWEQKQKFEIAMNALEEPVQIDMALTALEELEKLNGRVICALEEQKAQLSKREDYLSKLVRKDKR